MPQKQLRYALMTARGYSGRAQILDSGDWLPQRRRRVYMVFFLTDGGGESAVNRCLDFAISTQHQSALSTFLCPDVDVETSLVYSKRPRKTKKRWAQRTINFVRDHSLQPKVLQLMKKSLERCPAYHALTAREQRLLACRFAFIWQKHRCPG